MNAAAAERMSGLLAERFAGRTDCFLQELPNGATKKTSPFTRSILAEHLQGKRRVGIYVNLDRRASYLGFDFDGKAPKGKPQGADAAWAQLQRVAAVIDADLGLPCVVAEITRSGKGFAGYLFFDPDDRPTVEEVKRFGLLVLKAAGLPSDEKEEMGHPGVYPHPPKSERSEGKTRYLPWGGVLNGSPYSRFLDLATREPLDRQESALEDVGLVTRARLLQAIGDVEAGLQERPATSSGKRQVAVTPAGNEDVPAYGIMRDMAYDMVGRGVPLQEIRRACRAYSMEAARDVRHPQTWERDVEHAIETAQSKNHKRTSEGEPEIRELRALDLSSEPEPVPWIVPGWFASGDYHALAGLGKEGKSWIALHTTMTLASGCGSWLSRIAPQGGPWRVLYVDEEQGDALVLRRLHKLARGLGIPRGDLPDLPIRYLIRNRINLEDEGDLQSLFRAVEGFEPDLIVLDTLVRLHRSNENEAGPLRDLYAAAIQPLLGHYGCTVLGITHMNKPVRDGKRAGRIDLNRVRGTSELVNAADVILGLDDKTLYLLGGRHGDAEPISIQIEDTPEGGVVVRGVEHRTDDPGKSQPLPRSADKILMYLTGLGEPAAVHVIASQTDLHRNTVSKHLRDTLEPRGLIEQVGHSPFNTWRAIHHAQGEKCIDDED